MRRPLAIAGAVSALLIAVSIPTARTSVADEIYFCDDGRTLQVNSANRQKMMQDPCIQAWFQRTQSIAKSRAEADKKKAETAPQTMVGVPTAGSSSGGGDDFSGLIPLLFGRR